MDPQGNPVKDAKGRFQEGRPRLRYTVMEKRKGWGTEYPDDIRNGEWEYAVFGADGKFNDKANYKACFQCHKPRTAMDFVISYPAMAGRHGSHDAGGGAARQHPGEHRLRSRSAPAGVTDRARQDGDVDQRRQLSPHQVTVAGQAAEDRHSPEGTEREPHLQGRRRLQLRLRPAPEHEGRGRGQEVARRPGAGPRRARPRHSRSRRAVAPAVSIADLPAPIACARFGHASRFRLPRRSPRAGRAVAETAR